MSRLDAERTAFIDRLVAQYGAQAQLEVVLTKDFEPTVMVDGRAVSTVDVNGEALPGIYGIAQPADDELV